MARGWARGACARCSEKGITVPTNDNAAAVGGARADRIFVTCAIAALIFAMVERQALSAGRFF